MSTHDRIEELLLKWEELHQGGAEVSLEQLCADCPELLPKVRAGAEALVRMANDFGMADGRSTDFRTQGVPEKINNRYTIRRSVGSGGFAEVFEAWDERLLRSVAIKLPRRERFKSSQQWNEFLTEARTAASLKHRWIVPVHDVGWTAEGVCFIVLDYVDGGTLSDAIRWERFTPQRTAGLIADVAEAVDYANRQGLVHRDLKPSNILLDSHGQPYVSDFGLAAFEEPDVEPSRGVAGTPAYLAPEQVRGENHRLDGRTDLWALGVILYRLLTGQLPFRKVEGSYADDILYRDPKPPRQIDPTVPRELERICLRCLAKRMSERYATAADLAEDLRDSLKTGGSGEPVSAPNTQSTTSARAPVSEVETASDRSSRPLKVVPKGLRAYGARDAEFFLELLPGPRDREGLPESLRFWKQFIESPPQGAESAVGLLYGPSGCGKSSFLKAGLIPRLSQHVITVYVETTPDDLERRLQVRLERQFPRIATGCDLSRICRTLRDGNVLEPQQKVVIVLDQFEQWLHANRDEQQSGLLRALRQCDGERLQCLLSVREDFGMAAARFMSALEVHIVEGRNFGTVDRFNMAHARKVLSAFGTGFGQFPEANTPLSAAHHRFVEQAVEGLAEDGKVVPVRLALFAQMVKDRPWTPETLAQVGGVEGIGVVFLEESFESRSANPSHLQHAPAARKILKALLPEHGGDIRGRKIEGSRLLEASGYSTNLGQFAEVIGILDTEMRLISPAEAEVRDPAGGPPDFLSASDDGTSVSSSRVASPGRCYQLAHDYLVPAVRDWLTRVQRQTRRGRLEIELESQATLWNSRPTRRLLPTWWTWINALAMSPRNTWTAQQRRMMRAATRYHLTVSAVCLALAVATVLVTAQIRRHAGRAAAAQHALHLVQRLKSAESSETAKIISEIEGYRQFADPLLRQTLQSGDTDPEHVDRAVLHARLGLLPVDQSQLAPVMEASLRLDPDRLATVAAAIAPHARTVARFCWEVVDGDDRPHSQKFRAACLLAHCDADNPRWKTIARQTVAELVGEQILLASKWAEQLRPARRWLVDPLTELFKSPAASDRAPTLVAALLAEYTESLPALAGLIDAASHEQLVILLPAVHRHGQALVPYLLESLRRRPPAAWADEPALDQWPAPDASVVATVNRAYGCVFDRWALCHTLDIAEFDAVAATLARAGYRPHSLRPYRQGPDARVAVVWLRDGLRWAWAQGNSAELRDLNETHRAAGLVPFDVSQSGDGDELKFAVLWVEKPRHLLDGQLYLAVPEAEYASASAALRRSSAPRSNLLTSIGDRRVVSSIRWRFAESFDYEETWNEEAAGPGDANGGEWPLADLRPEMSAAGAPRYSTICWDQAGWSSTAERDISLEESLDRCRSLLSDGYRPNSVSVLWRPERRRLTVASCWGRPAPSEESRGALARQQANAAVVLLHLKRAEYVWPLLRLTPDPTVRTWLIQSFRNTGIDPDVLWKHLTTEPDGSIRQALLISLARFSASAMPRANVALVEELYQSDPDPGVHSAARVLLNSLRRPDLATQVFPEDGRRSWSHTVNGHVLAHVRGPVTFMMGSSANETHHQSFSERQHLVEIPRSFAIGTMEVTVEQFLKFKPDFGYDRHYAPEPACPVTMVRYCDALRYCRWLSDQDPTLTERDMCYPPVDQIDEKVERLAVPANCLERRGYRLPTEAEWEYACRAGTATSRSFGIADELLSQFAWTASSSQYRSWPVGMLLPNDLGLFDMLGNAKELCQNASTPYPRTNGTAPRRDDFEAAAFEANENPKSQRRWRGGAFLYQPADARSAHRDFGFHDSRFPFLSFRIARTLSSATTDVSRVSGSRVSD